MRCPRVSNEQGERVADVGATPLGDLHADTVVRHTGRPQARWDKLSAGGDPKAQQCGWLKDKYGASWQLAPNNMDDFLKDEKHRNRWAQLKR